MKTERKQKIEQLIETTFKNVAELNALLKKSDYDWADKMVNSDGDVYDNNGELAESILNVGDNLIDWGKMFWSWPKLNFPYNRRMMKQNKYTVDVAVTIFLQKEVTAGDEDEANQMAEDGISLNDVTKAYNNGECEIEIIGSEVEEEDSE